MTELNNIKEDSIVYESYITNTSKFGELQVAIREFKSEDAEIVKNICFNNIRSTSFAGVTYYLVNNAVDLLFYWILTLILMGTAKSLLLPPILLIYLFTKSRILVEHYLIYRCRDIRNVKDYYLKDKAGSNFFVAEVTISRTKEKKIVGIVGLLPHDKGCGKIVRLVVLSQFRRLKIGTHLLNCLEKYALKCNYSELYLFTNSLNPGHANFVSRHNFYLLSSISRGSMRGELLFWRKYLTDPNYEVDETDRSIVGCYND